MPAKRPTYEVLTWDIDKGKFTPQQGVRRGPYRLMALRRALRALAEMGYDTRRAVRPRATAMNREEWERRGAEALAATAELARAVQLALPFVEGDQHTGRAA